MNKYISFLILIFFFISDAVFSQTTDNSLAFKKNRPQKKYKIFYQPDLSYQIQQRFNLIREANAGDVLAQHELGLRFLLGEDGLEIDTIKGAYWIEQAAKQNLTAACFNYGILLLNGWGVEWNPFNAFDNFLKAANDGMLQAQHIIGILYTDNLIVKKDYVEAYKWVRKAADKGYAPALETKNELENYLPNNYSEKLKEESSAEYPTQITKTDTSLSSQLGLVFIDFDSIRDTTLALTDKYLIQDLFHETNRALADTLGLKVSDENLQKIIPERIPILEKFAECGNSEALTVLGRLNELGIFFKINQMNAALNYILASQLNYPRAKAFLLKILTRDFYDEVAAEIKNKNSADAKFVFYGLWNLGLYNDIIKDEAIKYLIEAANQNHLPSINELGNYNYTAEISSARMEGINLWRKAKALGSYQADVRLAAINILDRLSLEPTEISIQVLTNALSCGSVLAQIAMAYAYENGIGVSKSKSEAVKLYRLTAQRGNESGYAELKRMFDEIRPKDSRFIVN